MCKIDWELLPVWIQAICSLGGVIALYYLKETLKSQNITLNEQKELRRLELEKYEISNMPIFTVVNDDSSIKMKNGSIEFNIKLKCNYNIAVDLSFREIINKYVFDYSLGDVYYKDKIFSVNDILEIEVTIKNEKYNLIPESEEFNIIFSMGIFFKDKNKNQYFQELQINGHDGFHITNVKEVDFEYKSKRFGDD